MTNVFLTFLSFFTFLCFLHGVANPSQPVFFVSGFQVLFLALLFHLFRKTKKRKFLVMSLFICGLGFIFYGYQFSLIFRQPLVERVSQIAVALSMNASLVFCAIVGIFGLSPPTSENHDTQRTS